MQSNNFFRNTSANYIKMCKEVKGDHVELHLHKVDNGIGGILKVNGAEFQVAEDKDTLEHKIINILAAEKKSNNNEDMALYVSLPTGHMIFRGEFGKVVEMIGIEVSNIRDKLAEENQANKSCCSIQ